SASLTPGVRVTRPTSGREGEAGDHAPRDASVAVDGNPARCLRIVASAAEHGERGEVHAQPQLRVVPGGADPAALAVECDPARGAARTGELEADGRARRRRDGGLHGARQLPEHEIAGEIPCRPIEPPRPRHGAANVLLVRPDVLAAYGEKAPPWRHAVRAL